MQRGQQPPKARPPCRYFQSGNCIKDDCRFSHGAVPTSNVVRKTNKKNGPRVPADVGPSSDLSASGRPHSMVNHQANAETQTCSFYVKGRCNRGGNCRFSHAMEPMQGQSRPQGPIETAASIAPQVALGPSRVDVRRDLEAARAAEDATRLARIAQDEAAHTFKTTIAGSIVTFGAGGVIKALVPGFSISTVRITGLPINATFASLSLLIIGQDISAETFWIVSHNRYKQQCEVLVDRENANGLVEAIDDAAMGNSRLSATLDDADGLANTSNSSYALSMWWRAPFSRYVATYDSPDVAEASIRALNNCLLDGRRVNVFAQGGGYASPSVAPSTSIIVDALSPSISDEEVARFTGSESVVRQVTNVYDVDASLVQLGQHINMYAMGEPAGRVKDDSRPNAKMVNVRVPFQDCSAAERARITLEGKRFTWNGNQIIHTRLEEPVQYKLSIPVRQYDAQKRHWDELASSGADCSLKIDAPRFPGRQHVFILVSGKEKQAVGQLKVRAEDLARGETLGGWTMGLGQGFLDAVAARNRVFIVRDQRTRALQAFGEPSGVAQARAEIKEEEDRLASQEIAITLKPGVVPYFLRHGLAALREELGEQNARLDGPRERCVLIVRGGDTARRAVDRHLADAVTHRPAANTAEATCPVCYMEPSAPFRLGCGHIYCTVCAKHLLSSATDNKSFPLICIGDEAACGTPIPIPTIRKFLTNDAVTKLLDASFAAYIERNPDKLKYCRTAACEQVYATGGEQQYLTCPSCFATVCNSCDEGVHTGRTCAENADDIQRRRDLQHSDALFVNQNYKRCPKCQVLIEKTAGCNHMECLSCHAHFCWRCMRVFARDEIYEHMTTVHGGYGMGEEVGRVQVDRPRAQADPPPHPPRQPVQELQFGAYDILEQHRILRDIQERRNRAAQAAHTGWGAEVHRRAEALRQAGHLREETQQRHRVEAEMLRRQREEAERLQRQRAEAERRNGGGWGCTVM